MIFDWMIDGLAYCQQQSKIYNHQIYNFTKKLTHSFHIVKYLKINIVLYMSTVEELLKEADEAFQARDFDRTKEICRIGVRQLEKSSDSASIKATIKFLDILSESDIRLGRWFDAIISLERLVRLADQQRDLIAKAEATITIGDLFSSSVKRDKPTAKYEDAMTVFRTFSNTFHLCIALPCLVCES